MYAKFADPLRMQRHKIAVENQAVSDSNAPVKFRKNLKPHHHIQLDSEFKLDCEVWKTFLDMKLASVVNRPMIDLSLDLESSVLDLQFYSDASASETLGFGCVLMNRHWIGEM